MTETIIAAMVGAGAALLASLLGFVFQFRTTKRLIEAEDRRERRRDASRRDERAWEEKLRWTQEVIAVATATRDACVERDHYARLGTAQGEDVLLEQTDHLRRVLAASTLYMPPEFMVPVNDQLVRLGKALVQGEGRTDAVSAILLAMTIYGRALLEGNLEESGLANLQNALERGSG